MSTIFLAMNHSVKNKVLGFFFDIWGMKLQSTHLAVGFDICSYFRVLDVVADICVTICKL